MIGKRVFLRSLLARGTHLGTIIDTHDFSTENGYPICVVKLDRQEKPVRGVVFFEEEPKIINSNRFQICWPIREND